jgi:hypothetical protein
VFGGDGRRMRRILSEPPLDDRYPLEDHRRSAWHRPESFGAARTPWDEKSDRTGYKSVQRPPGLIGGGASRRERRGRPRESSYQPNRVELPSRSRATGCESSISPRTSQEIERLRKILGLNTDSADSLCIQASKRHFTRSTRRNGGRGGGDLIVSPRPPRPPREAGSRTSSAQRTVRNGMIPSFPIPCANPERRNSLTRRARRTDEGAEELRCALRASLFSSAFSA